MERAPARRSGGRVTRFPGIGTRLADRMRTLGYWKDGRPDVGRFCIERRYRPQYVYAWLRDRVPDYDNLRRLSSDLDVGVSWLVSGEGAATPKRRIHAPGRVRHRVAPRRSHGAAAVLDVSALRDAAERIVALQADLEAMLAAFPDPCLWVDAHGRILSAKRGTHKVIPANAVGRTLRAAMRPEASIALDRAIAHAAKSREPVIAEYQVTAAQDTRRTYEARVVPVAAGRGAQRFFIVLRDVTEHRKREHDYRDLVDGSCNGLCIHRGYVVQFANRTMARTFGYDRSSDLIGLDIRTLLPGHRTPAAGAPGNTARTTVTRRERLDAVTRNGDRFRVMAVVAAVTWQSRFAILLTVISDEQPVGA